METTIVFGWLFGMMFAYCLGKSDKNNDDELEFESVGRESEIEEEPEKGRCVIMSCQTCRKMKRHKEIQKNLFQCVKCKRHVDLR